MQHKPDPEAALALPSFRSLYALTAIVALLVAGDLLFWRTGYEGLRNPGGVNLSLIAAVLGGARIIYGAIAALLEGEAGADLALAIALIAALLLREYWVGAEVVLIAMVGESLEAITFSRTHREIRRILELRPRSVHLRRGAEIVEAPIDEVEIGDVVVIRPGERIPVDGAVISGRSAVDQSTLTGESLPVDKGEGDSVYAGSMNQFGAIEVRADAVGDDTTLGQVIQLVAEARRHKARIERVADRMARYFLPFVLTCAGATFIATNLSWIRAGSFPAASEWVWMPTLAVLVVACPCALILATPAAMMAALAWMARRGVLAAGGAALERLATVRRIAFDKTGTLTKGELELGECIAWDGRSSEEVLRWAALAEQSSEHLIARRIVQAAADQGIELSPVEDFQALPGAGVEARASGAAGPNGGPLQLLVGNRRLLSERGVAVSAEADAASERLEQLGQTCLFVCVNGRLAGVIGVRDAIRPEAAEVIQSLRGLGIERIALLTGDRRAAAAQVADAAGVDEFEAELRPAEKARWLARWRPPQEAGGRRGAQAGAAMVGDGVNDAPALASADVGLALAGVGGDLAAEAGDLILMGEPLRPLPGLVKLSRETVRIIRQNILLFAIVFNFAGIAITAWVMPSWSESWLRRSPVAAALFHQIGSLLVLLNAMRLLWFERWEESWAGRIETALSERAARWSARLDPIARASRWAWNRRCRIAGVGLLLLLAGYLSQILVVVQPDEVAVVQRCGRFRGVLRSGLHFRLPPPFDRVVKETPARIRTVEVGLRRVPAAAPGSFDAIEWASPHTQGALRLEENEAIMLTGDQSLVELGAVIQYRIRDVRAYRFAVREPVRVLRAVAEGVIRETLAGRPLLAPTEQPAPLAAIGERRVGSEKFTDRPFVDPNDSGAALEILTSGRGPIEERIGRNLQRRLDSLGLGVEILPGGVSLQDVHPPLAVVPSFRDVSSAFKEREKMFNEADADYRDKVIKAAGLAVWKQLSAAQAEVTEDLWRRFRGELQGEAYAAISSAEAQAAQREYLATGEAERFRLNDAAQAAAPQLTRWRLYLDALAEALPKKNKLILDRPGKGRRHLWLGLPRGPSDASLLLEAPSQGEGGRR